jgi:hypothetical protein
VSGELPVQTKKQRNKKQQKQTNKQINKQTNKQQKPNQKPSTGGESTNRFACIDILFDEPVGVGIGQFGGKGPVVGWVDCLGSSR